MSSQSKAYLSIAALIRTHDRMDVVQDAHKNLIISTFELPGMRKEDVSIDVHNNMLSISGESKISSDRDENGYAVRERRYGRFSRSIPPPQGVKVSVPSGATSVC